MTRSVTVELEVPGTPEQVWEAIATGPGISAWFVPTEIDGREGGTVRQQHGSDMDTSMVFEAWDPPRRLRLGQAEWQPTDAASSERMADEFIVEARSGGTCVVRVVTTGFGTGADWDRMMEGAKRGWASALFLLRLYLANFRGMRCAPIAVGGPVAVPADRAWSELTNALGIPEQAREGARVAVSAAGVPSLAGFVERTAEDELVLRIDEPASGVAAIYAAEPGDQAYGFVCLYLFGDDAPAVAAREETAWRAWMGERFPSPAPAGNP
jgi:uncharacterized protein YndB with AHSA1/START domain